MFDNHYNQYLELKIQKLWYQQFKNQNPMLPAEVCGCENFLRKHHLPVRVIKPSDVILWFLVDFFMPTNCECISKRLIEITPSWILVNWKCVLSRNFGEFNNNYRFVKNYLLHVGVRMWGVITYACVHLP